MTSDSQIKGYRTLESQPIDLVNANKEDEERLLRRMDRLSSDVDINPRWVAVARTHIQQGFMALNRAIMQPERVRLPEDDDPV